MNKIPLPRCDDNSALNSLVSNNKLASYPHLQSALIAIRQAYSQYLLAQGNALAINQVNLTGSVENYLRNHYSSPPKDLGYIKKIRDESEHLICPMCGSFHCGTVDHLLPKNGYAAFAIFSPNLVPACKCNSKRGEVIIGQNRGERILHPYFDSCLTERLIVATFNDPGPVPVVDIRLYISVEHPMYSAVDFHFRTIVKNTAIKNYLRDRWLKLCREPRLVIRALASNPGSIHELKRILETELDILDAENQGKNNWGSIFITGLLEMHVLHWLYESFNKEGRLPNGPLI